MANWLATAKERLSSTATTGVQSPAKAPGWGTVKTAKTPLSAVTAVGGPGASEDLAVGHSITEAAVDPASIPANVPDWSDDRRRCEQCRNLTDTAQCMAAYRGEPLGWIAPRIYHPVVSQPHYCAGYRPFKEDPDRRPGRERWPRLLASKEVAHG